MLKQRQRIFSAVTFFFIFWYIFLCSVHLYKQRSLWNDEECVLRSIENFSAKQMFGEDLMAYQVFPRVYLFLIQQFAKLFDFSRLALRLPSFICMIAAFLLWLRIARNSIKDRWQYLAFVCSWPASGMMLYYSAELKQYSMDVLAAALFILFLCRQDALRRERPRRYMAALIALPALGLFSYPAFLIAMIPLYNLVVLSIREKACRKYLAVYAMSLTVIILLSYFIDMRHRPTDVLSREWRDYFVSFASLSEFLQSLGEGINNLFSRWFVEYPKFFKSLGRIFIGWGLINVFYAFFANRKKEGGMLRSLDTVAFVLFLEMFLIGCLQKYPFTVPRTSLFYAPIVFYLTATGIGLAARVHPYLYRLILGLYFVFLGFLAVMQSFVAFYWDLGFYPRIW
ncbi:MAG: glycosyltransferase family 39 protein [Candidatus Omnitrophica bacterium]|nr:glycosyltransferase family 39 protein [Candidatus Omnitrophota bacterium]